MSQRIGVTRFLCLVPIAFRRLAQAVGSGVVLVGWCWTAAAPTRPQSRHGQMPTKRFGVRTEKKL
jgi:hypothetical protein